MEDLSIYRAGWFLAVQTGNSVSNKWTHKQGPYKNIEWNIIQQYKQVNC